MNDRHDDERFGELLDETIARRATSISARPNEGALFARVGARATRQRRVLAAAAVVAVAVASITGYAVATTSRDGDASVQTPGAAPSDPGTSASPTDGAVAADEGPLMHVFTRTANGITVRVYTTPHTDNPNASSGYFVAEMSNDAAVGVGRTNCYGLGLRGSGTFGGPEGSPVEWVIVETATAPGARYDQPSTTGVPVRAEFDGGVDEMVPVGGIAVLVAPGAGGTVLVEGPGVGGSTTIGQPVDTDPAPCPPATLPPPGPQPDDVAAAEAGVRQAYADANTGSNPAEVKWAAVEDGEHLFAVLGERIRQGARDAGFTDEALAAMTITTGDIVFTDETHAAVLYDIAIPGYNEVEPPGRLGYAVYVDGRWKVARETRCGHLAQINVECP